MLAVATLAGLVVGSVSASVIVVLSGYLVWNLVQLYRLERWLRSRRADDPPDAPGLWGEIFDHYYRLQKRNRRRKSRIARLFREFRESTSAMPDGAVVLDRSWRIVWTNAAAEEMLGLKRTMDLGQRAGNLIRHPAFVRYLSQGNFEHPVEIDAPDEPGRRLSLHLVPFGEGQRLLMIRDITRVHRLQQMRREFVANASHELRSPLTVIAGYLEAMASDPDLDGRWRRPLAEMERQSDRMTRIIDDLLELSRLETGERRPAEDRVDIGRMVQRLREDARALATGQAIDTDGVAEVPLLGAESEIYSAFYNLVSNAVRYTPDDGRIALSWRVDAEGGHFEVRDTGVGIDARHIPRLTERFYRAHKGRERGTGGTGLGLAIVKHVLQRHDGRLEVRSEPGKGSTFVCHFPASRLSRETGAAV